MGWLPNRLPAVDVAAGFKDRLAGPLPPAPPRVRTSHPAAPIRQLV
jgi:hypothetical protein